MTNKYWNGMEVCVVANDVPGMKGKAIVRVVKNFNKEACKLDCFPNTADTLVDKDNLEPLVTDMFKLGDHVRRINGSMIGTVVGFEPSTNLAVVMSDKIKNYQNDRTRYSYKPEELELFNADEVKVAPGCWYTITYREDRLISNAKLMAVQSVFNEDEVMLFTNKGTIMFNNIAKTASKKHLKDFNNILSIERLGNI